MEFLFRGHENVLILAVVKVALNILKTIVWYTVLFFFLPRHAACRILVPQPGIEPRPLAVKVPSPNHWTAREVPVWCTLNG